MEKSLPLNVWERTDIFIASHFFWLENLSHVFSVQVPMLVPRNTMLTMNSECWSVLGK